MSLSVMAGNAFANGLHVVWKAFVDLDAAEPRRSLPVPRGTAPRCAVVRIVTKPLRIQHHSNGAHRAAFLRCPRLYPAIHRIGYVQCRSHGDIIPNRPDAGQYGIMDLCIRRYNKNDPAHKISPVVLANKAKCPANRAAVAKRLRHIALL